MKSPRVHVEVRPTYTIDVSGRRRRFHTEGAAYYAHIKAQLGAKYLGPLKAVDDWPEPDVSVAVLEQETGVPEDVIRARAARARALFYSVDETTNEGEHFDPSRWQAYVRRVVTKMRQLDGRVPRLPPAPVDERDAADTAAGMHALARDVAAVIARGHDLWRSELSVEQRSQLQQAFKALRRAVR